jgi:hypothetical protein
MCEVDRIQLGEDGIQWRAVVNTVMNHRFLLKEETFFKSWSSGL